MGLIGDHLIVLILRLNAAAAERDAAGEVCLIIAPSESGEDLFSLDRGGKRLRGAATGPPGEPARNIRAAGMGLTLNHTVNAIRTADVRHTESRNSGVRAETIDLLLSGHQREEVVDALFSGQVGSVKRIVLQVPLIHLLNRLRLLLGQRRRNRKEERTKKDRSSFVHRSPLSCQPANYISLRCRKDRHQRVLLCAGVYCKGFKNLALLRTFANRLT